MLCCMFMHACLCTAWFHAWCWMCRVYLHQRLNSICGLKKEKKKKWLQGLQLPVLIGKLIMSLWVGYLRVYVCERSKDLSLEAACDRGSSVLLTPPQLQPQLPLRPTTDERTEVLPSPAEGRTAARNRSPTITLSSVQIKHFSMCVVMRSSVFLCETYLSAALLPTVADLALSFTAVDVFPSPRVLL